MALSTPLDEIISFTNNVIAEQPSTLRQIGICNLKVMVYVAKHSTAMTSEELVALREVSERLALAAINRPRPYTSDPDSIPDIINMFIDCGNTFRSLFLDNNNKMLYPDAVTEQTIEVCATFLAGLLAHQQSSVFAQVADVIVTTDHVHVKELVAKNKDYQLIIDLHNSMTTGSLEASIKKALAAITDIRDGNGFDMFIEGLVEITIRNEIALGLEQSYQSMPLEDVFRVLHIDSTEQLDRLIANRQCAREECIEDLAYPDLDEQLHIASTRTNSYKKQLKNHELANNVGGRVIEKVEWSAKDGVMYFEKPSAARHLVLHEVKIKELKRLKDNLRYANFIENAF